MCVKFYFLFFDNDVYIVYNVFFKNKKLRQINLISRFVFNKKLLIILIAKMLVKFFFIIEYFFIMFI